MGIFNRLKQGIRARVNAAIDPEKELDIIILELEEQHRAALRELVAYKTTAKQMEQDLQRYQDKAAGWEKRAMEAVKAGDDELAKKALKEQKLAQAEVEKIQRDHDEAAGYAIQLNKSRKTAEAKLRILKLKKGSMAAQLAAARSGNTNPFGQDDEVWDRFARAEEMIDKGAIEAEVDAALQGEEADGSPLAESELEAKILGAGAVGADDELAKLKKKMADDKAKKKLGSGAPPPEKKPE